MDTARDVVIIVWGTVGTITLLVILAIAVSIGLSVRNLVTTVNKLVDTSVKPVIDTSQQTVANVTGTTQFLGDLIVTPVVRIISLISGLRRGLAVFAGVRNRVTGKRGAAVEDKP